MSAFYHQIYFSGKERSLPNIHRFRFWGHVIASDANPWKVSEKNRKRTDFSFFRKLFQASGRLENLEVKYI